MIMGKRVVELCAERGLCVGKTYFGHKSLNIYASVESGQDGMEVKSMINLMLMKKDMLYYVQDVRAMREMRRGFSGHHVVLRKVMLDVVWIKRREVED